MKKILCALFVLTTLNSYSQQKNKDVSFKSSQLEYKFVPSITDQINDGTFINAEESSCPEVERKDKKLRLEAYPFDWNIKNLTSIYKIIDELYLKTQFNYLMAVLVILDFDFAKNTKETRAKEDRRKYITSKLVT